MEVNQLPIKEIVIKSLYLVKIKHFELIRLSMPLIVVSFLILIYNKVYPLSTGFSLVMIILWLIQIATLLLATVGAHKVFLLSEKEVKETLPLRWTSAEARFLGWFIVIGLCAALLGILFSVLLMPYILALSKSMTGYQSYSLALGGIIIYFPVYYFVSRWALILPATAIGEERKSLPWAWGLSKGNGFRLFLLLGCIPLATNFVISLLDNSGSIILGLISIVVWLSVGAVEICFLSLSYSFLSSISLDDDEG